MNEFFLISIGSLERHLEAPQLNAPGSGLTSTDVLSPKLENFIKNAWHLKGQRNLESNRFGTGMI